MHQVHVRYYSKHESTIGRNTALTYDSQHYQTAGGADTRNETHVHGHVGEGAGDANRDLQEHTVQVVAPV